MSYFETARFKKSDPEEIYRKGKKVWADRRGWTVTTKTKPRPSFGMVEKTSKWPDCWVTIGIWNKEEFCAWDNWDRGIKQKPVEEPLKTMKRLPRAAWKPPKISGKKALAKKLNARLKRKKKGKTNAKAKSR